MMRHTSIGRLVPHATSGFRRCSERRSCGFTTTVLTLFALVGLTGACIDRNHVHSIPSIHGRVVDAATKKPIAGMTLVRRLIRQEGLGPGGSDATLVRGSVVTVTSDDRGRFELPQWRGLVRGVDRLEWAAFKSGYMPGRGWFRSTQEDPRHPGYDGRESDPWVAVRFQEVAQGLEMTLEVSRPTLDGIVFRSFDGHRWVPMTPAPGERDPWAEYFRRLNVFVIDSLIQDRVVVFEAAAFLEHHTLSEGMLDPLADITDSTRRVNDPEVQDARRRVLQVIADVCTAARPPTACQTIPLRDAVNSYQEEFGTPGKVK